MKLIDGRLVANEILDGLSTKILELRKTGVMPKIAVILVGDDEASKVYVKYKQKACVKIGLEFEQFNYGSEMTTEELVSKIEALNADKSVHGILVQLPLPKHIDKNKIINTIDARKDVDGFTVDNVGRMYLMPEVDVLSSCTPSGVIKLLDYYDIEIEGKHAVVVGRSNIVGKPLSTMLLNRNATVTICHGRTKDLASHTKTADILCVAVGRAGLITADMVKDGAVVIDIGINRSDSCRLVGDVDFDEVSKVASYITPVPGGVGPMTIAMLMSNTVKAASGTLN